MTNDRKDEKKGSNPTLYEIDVYPAKVPRDCYPEQVLHKLN